MFYRPDAVIDRWCADLDRQVFGLDVTPPTFMIKTWPATDPMLDAINRLASELMMNPGLSAGSAVRLRCVDEEAMIGQIVTRYHDYPGPDQFDQIDARDCA